MTKRSNFEGYSLQEQQAGAPLGEDLRQLFDLARRLDPEAPETAFSALGLELDWLKEPARHPDALRTPVTPRNVLPVGMITSTLDQFGFLMVPGDPRPLDERAIVYVDADEDPPAQVVSPNLRTFLSLVARDEPWALPEPSLDWPWYDGEDAESAAMLRAELRNLRGVSAVENPAEVFREAPTVCFDLPPQPEPQFVVHRDPFSATRDAVEHLRRGRFELALRCAEVGRASRRNGTRSELVIIEALAKLERRDEARDVWRRIAERWLGDPSTIWADHWDGLAALQDELNVNDPGRSRAIREASQRARDSYEGI